MTKQTRTGRRCGALVALGCGVALAVSSVDAATVSFQVDPATIDTSPADGFITGTEFSPTGSDGTVFTMMPTNNLVGSDRFLLSAADGLQFGGGGGSTLSFDFTTNQDITLDRYVLGNGFFLSNPDFDIRDGAIVLSAANTSVAAGDGHAFNTAPISINSGTTYSFVVNSGGAAVQSFMESWDYTLVPEPASAGLLGLLLLVGRGKRKATQN